MIVDVLRNDLGRVCEPGSVRVPRLLRLERTAAVQHLVTTVTGPAPPRRRRVRPARGRVPRRHRSPARPKIRAMELIERLEPVRRGPYCGTLLWLGPDGRMGSSDPDPDVRRRRRAADAPRRRRDHLAQRSRGRVGRDGRQGARAAVVDRGGRGAVVSDAGTGPRYVWVNGELLAGRRAAPVGVRPRLPAGRRPVRDAPRPRRPRDRARGARRTGSGGRRTGSASSCPPTLERDAPAGASRSCWRPRAWPAPTATPRSGSPSRAGRGRRAACCRRATSTSSPTIAIQAWPVVPAPADHLERGLSLVASSGAPGPGEPGRDAQDDEPRRLRLRAPRGPPRRRRRRAVPDAVRPPVRVDDRERVPRPTRGRRRRRSSRPRRSTARSCRARRARGCCAGPTASGLRAVEGWLTPDELAAADEAFVCSSVAGVLPVTRFDGASDRRRAARARGRSAPAPTASGSSPAAERPDQSPAAVRAVPVSCGRRSPRRARLDELRQAALARVSGRFALMTQCVASRR